MSSNKMFKKKTVVRLFSYISLFAWTFVILADGVSANWLGGGTVSCGNIGSLPERIPVITSTLLNAVMVIVPVLLVIFGIVDLVRGVMSQKEEDVKKGQQTLIKRIIIGMLIFLVVILAKLIVNLVADNTETRDSIISCVNCFVNGPSSCN